MGDENLKKLVEAAAVDVDERRVLRCADAFKLAAEHGIDLPEITRICNSSGIRICSCQLGCFK